MADLPRRSLLATAAAASFAATSGHAAPATTPLEIVKPLELVAKFEQQVTGVAVSKDNRIFVNFPRWEQDVAISVAEVGPGGRLTPFPNAEWNAWRNAKKLSNGDHFVCVQSVVAGPQNTLWVLDPAAPGNEFNIEGGPKLVEIDLGTNQVKRTILFDRAVIPQGSYLNDVRFSPDGKWAYITDSGVVGALIAVDLTANKPRRLLSGHVSTQLEADVTVMTDGKKLQRPDNRGPAFAADGIALDPKGEYVYWQALAGKTLYRISTKALTSPDMADGQVAAAVEKLGTTCVADGYWMDGQGRLFITSPEDNSVKLRQPDGSLKVVAQDRRLRWPDSMAEGPDAAFYVTASHIQDMAMWHEHGSTRNMPYMLFKFRV